MLLTTRKIQVNNYNCDVVHTRAKTSKSANHITLYYKPCMEVLQLDIIFLLDCN